jgi:hypothetical protein
VKILTVIIVFSIVISLVAILSQYSFVVALVDYSTESDVKPILRNSIVVVRKISLSKDIVGKRICFWRHVSYLDGNIRIEKTVMGIGIVTNPDPTATCVEDESDSPFRSRATRTQTIHWNNVTGEFVTIFNIPFSGA